MRPQVVVLVSDELETDAEDRRHPAELVQMSSKIPVLALALLAAVSGWTEVLTPAAAVPLPYQVSLSQPALSLAEWDAGEAGVAAALTGDELLTRCQ